MSRMGWLGAALAVLAGCSSAGAATGSTTTAAQSTFTLTSPVLQQDGALPVEYTCDGSSTTPPLAWSGAPAGTVGYAVVLHHVPGPPCSKGPGVKLYTFTVYALSAQPSLPDPSTVSRDVLLTAIDGLVLGTVTLDVTYDRTGLTS